MHLFSIMLVAKMRRQQSVVVNLVVGDAVKSFYAGGQYTTGQWKYFYAVVAVYYPAVEISSTCFAIVFFQ
jgi:hypothetical protein